MMRDYTIMVDREKANRELLYTVNPSIPEVMRQLAMGLVFVALEKGKGIASCIVMPKEGGYEIVNWVVEPARRGEGIGRALLHYAFDYTRFLGGRYVELGAANSSVASFQNLQHMGFRVYGVERDRYLEDSSQAMVENGILRRDMIRYRFDFN